MAASFGSVVAVLDTEQVVPGWMGLYGRSLGDYVDRRSASWIPLQ